MDLLSLPIITLSFANSNCSMPTSFFAVLAATRAASFTKLAKSESESAKVSIRNSRKDANNKIKNLEISDDLKSNLEIDTQDLTDKYIKKVDEMYSLKEKDILTL